MPYACNIYFNIFLLFLHIYSLGYSICFSRDAENRPRYKARIVVKGFQQKKGVDFDEIFAQVVKMTSIQMMLSIAASIDLEVEQLEVKTTFLHGDLEEEILGNNWRDSSKSEGEPDVTVEEELIRTEAGSPAMVLEVRLLHDRPRVSQIASRSLRVCKEVRRRRLPDTPSVRGRHVDRQTGPSQDTDAEEGSLSNLRDERLGSGKTDTGDAYHPGPIKEAIVAVTGKVHDKGNSVVQHVESEIGWIDTPDKLQVN